MSGSISRRKIIAGGLAAAAGASGLTVAARLANRYGLIPPDHGGIFGVGETLTYASQKLLSSAGSMAREFSRADISKAFPVNGEPPDTELYQRFLAEDFKHWRLKVDGLVAQPYSFSLAELKNYPPRTQITLQACEEGWSFIAEWTGVPLAYLLSLTEVLPQAKYAVFFPFDQWWESLDLADVFHPQTLLAYEMNGQTLPAPHGAPVRLRVPRQLGYKSVKYLSRITLAASLKDFGKGLGSSSPEAGYAWYAGI